MNLKPRGTSRFDVTTIGETMLRLSVGSGQRLSATTSLDVHLGGAESNVCAALASLQRRCGWVSALPDNPLGHMALRQLRAFGIDTSTVHLAANSRMGTYYVEFAAAPRAIQVFYDRSSSAAAALQINEVDWDYMLDTRVLHLTGITPALSESCRDLVSYATKRAKEAGVIVSFDVNYRSRLWSPEAARHFLSKLINDVDLLICGQSDAETVFGFSGDAPSVLHSLSQISQAKFIVITLGSAGAVARHETETLSQAPVRAKVIDRLGAGDAFAAGILDGWLDGSPSKGLKHGTALAALALSQAGDMLYTNREELTEVLVQSEVQLRR